MTDGPVNERIIGLMQEISPDADSSVNEEIREAAEALGISADSPTVNDAIIFIANTVIGTQSADQPSPAMNELLASSGVSAVNHLRITQDGRIRITQNGLLRRTA